MRATILALVCLALSAPPALAQRPVPKPPGRDAPFDAARVTQRFVITAKGGHIEIAARDEIDRSTVEQVRRTLRELADAFGNGTFDQHWLLGDEPAPGADVMARMTNRIRYDVRQGPAGARLVIEASNFNAKDAVHRFLTHLNQRHADRSKR
jgi:hypothetical protein